MKKICLSTFMVILWTLCGCTQNDGHLGPIFGSWSLVSVTEDGVSIDLEDETVFAFQGEIVKIVRLVNPPYSIVTRYGNFTLSGNMLALKFQAGPTPSGSQMYMAPEWLHLPQDGLPIDFRILRIKGSEMEFELDTDGKNYVYYFSKTW